MKTGFRVGERAEIFGPHSHRSTFHVETSFSAGCCGRAIMNARADHIDDTFDNQFYPTPRSLGIKMYCKFSDKHITRLLEPEGGRGDLADVVKDQCSRQRPPLIECVEIDLANQAILRAKGYRVVGTDFLKYKGASVYSHIIMNPPFKYGVKHVLHAWELLFTGEIVAALPARAVKYPTNAEQRQLARLLQDNGGTVEYMTEAFMTEDTKRTTRVDIALIHLKKTSTEYASFIDGLQKEVEQRHGPAPESMNELIIPRDLIENLVINFECAVEAAKDACVSQARANHYAARFDRSITGTADIFVAKGFNKTYDELKELAWSTVLRSSAVLEKLSSQAQKRVEAEFKELCAMEFTYENIWGFLDGIIAQQGQIQVDMICDVFDVISKYHTENRAYYQGWKSNDKHRLNAFRIKTTRFILPCAGGYQGSQSLGWDNSQRFRDFDKVFAMLDGKKPDAVFGVEKLFEKQWDSLRSGARMSAEYFDARYYPRAGTFHMFPRRKDLIDRMNRIVGEHRKWLPHDKSAVPPEFWNQYDAAEKIRARMPDMGRLEWWAFRSSREGEEDYEANRARTQIMTAYQKAAGELGIAYDPSMLLEHERKQMIDLPKLPHCSQISYLDGDSELHAR